MGYTKREIEDMEVAYEAIGFVFNHVVEKEGHRCFTCDRPSISEFCSSECFEMRNY